MVARLETQAEPIPGYRLMARLGGGGFGEVWKAEAPGGLHKAIKFVYGDLGTHDVEDGARAEQELKALNRVKRIRHPFILSLDRADIVNGQLMIVMELADRSMWDRYKDCRAKGLTGIPRDELLDYMLEAADALDYMNFDEDLLHLDIKPQNLFLVLNHVKIADFGLVKDLQGLVASMTGGATPVYAAPETFDGYVSRFSDQYSLAIVFQELLCGQRPFSGSTTRQLISQHLHSQPNVSPLPVHDQDIVMRALAKDPNTRHRRCLDFVRALRAAGKPGRPTASAPGAGLADTTPETSALTPMPAGVATRPQESELMVPTKVASLQSAQGPGEAEPRTEISESVIATKPAPPQTDSHAPALNSELVAATNFSPPRELIVRSAGSAIPGLHAGTTEADAPASDPSSLTMRHQRTNDGVLLPALVIGLGGIGRAVLQHLRKQLELRHGDLADLPHLRLLAIDTDPEPISPAIVTKGNEELLTVRLSRPNRYLRPKDTMIPPEDWLDTMMIYRIPRNPATAGIRALGRLALVEHYRLIAARLRRELQQIVAPESLETSIQHSGMNARTNWPRVIVVASLAGGTGSGMFLDTAYLVRSLLEELGYQSPDVNAMCFFPPLSTEESANDLGMANVFAALLEMHHFGQKDNRFVGRYDIKHPPIENDGPAFARCTLLPASDAALPHATAAAADGIYRELMTPLGQVSDEARDRWRLTTSHAHPTEFASIGSHVLASPYRALVRRSAESVCNDLITAWMSKDVSQLLTSLRLEVEKSFKRHQFEPTGVTDQLQKALAADLGKPVDRLLMDWFATVRHVTGTVIPDLQPIHTFLNRVEELFGPVHETNSLRPNRVPRVLQDAAENLTRRFDAQLCKDILAFVDRPGLRLGGAEEGIQQGLSLIEKWLATLEQETERAGQTVSTTADRLKTELAECDRLRQGIKSRKPGPPPNPAPTALRYAQALLQLILVQRVLSTFLSLRGRLSDQIKEMRFVRNRFGELQAMFEPAAADAAADVHNAFLPFGCKTINGAVAHLRKSLTPDDLRSLDVAIQDRLNQIGKLSQIGVIQTQQLRQMASVILQEGERFVKSRLPTQDVAEVFLQRHTEGEVRLEALLKAYDAATPTLLRPPAEHADIQNFVVAPATAAGQKVTLEACGNLARIKPVLTPNQDEIVFFRECPRVDLTTLEQLGPVAREAYALSCSVEHFTPHARQDIRIWTEPS